MSANDLVYKTLKNSGYGFLGYVIPIAVAIVVTPIFIKYLGVTDYGVYVLTTTLTAFLGLLDFGFSVSLIRMISVAVSRKETDRLHAILNVGFSLFFVMGLIGLLVFMVIANWGLGFFGITSQSVPHIRSVFFLGGVLFFTTALSGVYQVLPHAFQRFDITTKLTTIQLVLTQCAILGVVLLGYKLKVVLGISVISSVLLWMGYIRQTTALVPGFKPHFLFETKILREIIQFGSLAAINNLASSALIQLDRLIIPLFLGPAALAFYSVPGSIVTKVPGVTSSLSGIFFPLTSSLAETGNTAQLRIVYERTVRNLFLLSAALAVPAFLFAEKLLKFWINEEFAQKSTGILMILAATHFVLGVYTPITNFILGLGKVKFLAIVSTGLALLNAGLLFVLIPKMGIEGAAWAYLAGVIPMLGIVYYAERVFLLLENRAYFYITLFAKLTIVTVVVGLITKYILLAFTTSLVRLVFIGPFTIFLFFLFYWFFGFFNKEDISLVERLIHIVQQRISKKHHPLA